MSCSGRALVGSSKLLLGVIRFVKSPNCWLQYLYNVIVLDIVLMNCNFVVPLIVGFHVLGLLLFKDKIFQGLDSKLPHIPFQHNI